MGAERDLARHIITHDVGPTTVLLMSPACYIFGVMRILFIG